MPGHSHSHDSRFIELAGRHCADMGNARMAGLLSELADIVLILDDDGTVCSASFAKPLEERLSQAIKTGTRLQDLVSADTRPKVEQSFEQVGADLPATRRQLNFPVRGSKAREAFLPVSCAFYALPGSGHLLTLGTDLSDQAVAQQRLVAAQLDLEQQYRALADRELRYRVAFQKIAQPVLLVSGETGLIVQANQSAEQMLDCQLGALAGTALTDHLDQQDAARFQATMQRCRGSGAREEIAVRLTEKTDQLTCLIEPYRDTNDINILVQFAQRTTLFSTTRDDHSLLESLPDAAAECDTKGIVLSCNDAFLDLVQLIGPDAAIGVPLSDWLGGSTVDVSVLLSHLKDAGTVRRFSTVLRSSIGSTLPITISAKLSTPDIGEPTMIVIIRPDPATAPRTEDADSGAPNDDPAFSELVGRVPLKDLVRDASNTIERNCIIAALRLTNNNRASAAEMLGLSRQSLYVKLKRYKLEDFTG